MQIFTDNFMALLDLDNPQKGPERKNVRFDELPKSMKKAIGNTDATNINSLMYRNPQLMNKIQNIFPDVNLHWPEPILLDIPVPRLLTKFRNDRIIVLSRCGIPTERIRSIINQRNQKYHRGYIATTRTINKIIKNYKGNPHPIRYFCEAEEELILFVQEAFQRIIEKMSKVLRKMQKNPNMGHLRFINAATKVANVHHQYIKQIWRSRSID